MDQYEQQQDEQDQQGGESGGSSGSSSGSSGGSNNSNVDPCAGLNDIQKCPSYNNYASALVSPYLETLKTDIVELIKSGAVAASNNISQASEKASEGLAKVVAVINAIPIIIRDNSIFTSKVVATNVQALTDVLASEANPKKPPVTKANMTIIKFLEEKQGPVYKQLLELGSKMKDLPPEKRGYELIAFNKKYLKPILDAPAQA